VHNRKKGGERKEEGGDVRKKSRRPPTPIQSLVYPKRERSSHKGKSVDVTEEKSELDAGRNAVSRLSGQGKGGKYIGEGRGSPPEKSHIIRKVMGSRER